MATGPYNSQLVFTHDIGAVPARVGVFFSALCSDDDPYISVARYSWGVFNPKQIEVNKKQVVLHMSQELHAGGFWIPNSWADGRYYRYGAGCFKVTCGSTGEFDSGWFDAHDNKGGANWIASNQDSNDRKWFGYSHQFDGIPKSVQVFFSPQPVSGGELEPDEMTALLKELRTEGRKRISPHFQISFCYPVYPAQPQLAVAYDIAAISEVIDFFVPMGCEQHSALSVLPVLPL